MDIRFVWTRTLSQEFWAGIVSPLMYSIAGGLIQGRMAKKGLRIAGLQRLQKDPFLRLFHGRVYLNSHILEEVVRRIPSVFVTPEVLRFLPKTSREALSQVRVSLFSPGFLRILLRIVFLERDWNPFTNYKAFDRATDRIEKAGRAQTLSNIEDFSEPALIDQSRRLYGQMGDYLEIVIWGVLFAYLTRPLIERLAKDWGEDREGDLAGCLRVALDGVKTFEINREIENLADLVEGDPRLKEWFDSSEPREMLARFRKDGEATGFLERLQTFLESYGHRFLGRDIRQATWRERPETVVEMIGLNRDRDSCRNTFALQRRKREEAERALKRRIGRGAFGLPRKVLFSLLLFLDKKYFVLRENMRYFADIYLEQFRRIYLEIGRRWALEGMLESGEDILFLEREEIEQVGQTRKNCAEKIAQRKEEYEQARRVEPPEEIEGGEDQRSASPSTGEATPMLEGEVASPGHATGPARIIREPKDLAGFRKGDILVAHCTDPSWAPVLPLAAGLVLEVGGLLSHGAIVAREYGIPALIRVGGAVEGLRDGVRLELDTERKCVRICPTPSPSKKPYPLDNSEQIK